MAACSILFQIGNSDRKYKSKGIRDVEPVKEEIAVVEASSSEQSTPEKGSYEIDI